MLKRGKRVAVTAYDKIKTRSLTLWRKPRPRNRCPPFKHASRKHTCPSLYVRPHSGLSFGVCVMYCAFMHLSRCSEAAAVLSRDEAVPQPASLSPPGFNLRNLLSYNTMKWIWMYKRPALKSKLINTRTSAHTLHEINGESSALIMLSKKDLRIHEMLVVLWTAPPHLDLPSVSH